MKATSFINSKDIARYLTKIKYNFNSLECAFLVWQSYKPLKEKQAAWQEIIDTMQDCDFLNQSNTKTDSLRLHAYLKMLLQNQREFLDDFFKADGGIFSYSPMYEGEDYMNFDNGLFADYSSCLKAAKNFYKTDRMEVEFRIRKQYAASQKDIILTMNLNQEVIKIDRYNGEEDVLGNRFKELFFEFPVPFQKGDILKYGDGIKEEVFVFTNICSWGERYPERKRGSADMTAHGYFVGTDESIYYDCVHNYLNCEFYDEEYSGAYRSLNLLSDYLNSQIGLDVLMNLYHAILSEQESSQRQDWAEGQYGIQTERYGFSKI